MKYQFEITYQKHSRCLIWISVWMMPHLVVSEQPRAFGIALNGNQLKNIFHLTHNPCYFSFKLVNNLREKNVFSSWINCKCSFLQYVIAAFIVLYVRPIGVCDRFPAFRSLAFCNDNSLNTAIIRTNAMIDSQISVIDRQIWFQQLPYELEW